MSDDQRKRYEEAAKEYAKKEYGSTWITVFEQKDFLAGTEHAHPIGFNLGKEEGKKEGWNEAIEEAATLALDIPYMASHEIQLFIEELKKLKR